MIYLFSGSGAPNYGDELMLALWLHYIGEHAGSQPLTIETHIPKNTPRCVDVPAGAEVKCEVWQLAKAASEGLDFWQALEKGLTFFEKGLHRKHSDLSFVSKAHEIKIFHMHGGGYITTGNAKSGFLLGLAASLNRAFETRVCATGQGIEPFACPPEKRPLVSRALSAFEMFECRDRVGAAKLQEITGGNERVFHGLDDNYLERPVPHPSALERDRAALHLSVSWPFPKQCDATFFSRLAALRKDFPQVIVWQSYPWKEKDSVIRLVRELGNPQVFSTEELVRNGPPVRPGDMMLTAKFHPHFVGARLGARGYYISNSNYYNIKHDSIVERGSGFRRFEDSFEIPGIPEAGSRIMLEDADNVRKKRETARRIYGGM